MLHELLREIKELHFNQPDVSTVFEHQYTETQPQSTTIITEPTEL